MTSSAALPVSLDSERIARFEHISDIVAVAKTYLVVMMAILIWDTLAMLPTERRFIWRARWTPIKVFYLLNRYWTILLMTIVVYFFLSDIPPSVCEKVARFEPGGAVITTMACACILTIRIWALYQHSRGILFFLCLLMLVEAIVLGISTSQFQPISLPPPITGCVAAGKFGNAGFVIAFWAAPLLFDTVIVLLAIFHVVRLRRESHARSSPILRAFLRESVFYYVVIFTVDAINIIFYTLPDPAIQSINSGASIVLTSLMASRVVLHLHASNRQTHLPSLALHHTVLPVPKSHVEGAVQEVTRVHLEGIRVELGMMEREGEVV